MSDTSKKKEINRMLRLLRRMAELSEHVEQTGSFEGAAQNSIRRYNAIVEHLESEEILHEDLFPRLDEDSDFAHLGAESSLLANYLEDLLEDEHNEAKEETKKFGVKSFDKAMLVALAPFLGARELKKILHRELGMANGEDDESDERNSERHSIQSIIGLAPHLDKKDLDELVLAYIRRGGTIHPKQLVALAPHISKETLSMLVRASMSEPDGEGAKPTKPEPPTPPPPPTPEEMDIDGMGFEITFGIEDDVERTVTATAEELRGKSSGRLGGWNIF